LTICSQLAPATQTAAPAATRAAVPAAQTTPAIPAAQAAQTTPVAQEALATQEAPATPAALPAAQTQMRTWEKDTVITGETANVSIALNAADADADCTKKVWLPINRCQGAFGCSKVSEYELGESFEAQFGKVLLAASSGSAGNDVVKFPDAPTGAAKTASSPVKVTVTCSNDSKPNGSREQDCPLLIGKAPDAVKSGTLAFTGGRAGTGVAGVVYFVGDTPAYGGLTLGADDNTVKYCGEIEYVAGVGWTKDTPLATVNSQTTINVTAQCSKSKEVLGTATATVVPNPTLTGTCTWTPASVDINVGTADLGGNVGIERNYGRCTALSYGGPYALPLKVTPAIAAENPDGKIEEFFAQTDCGTYGGILKKFCSALYYDNVNVDPGDEVGNCKYQWKWCSPNNTDEKGWPFASVMKNYSSIKNACIFVNDISKLNGGTWTINGVNHQVSGTNPTANIGTLPAKKDNGYYVWLPKDMAIDNADKFTVTAGAPVCDAGVPRRGVIMCKSHCGTTPVGNNAPPVTATIDKDTEYILTIYGQDKCKIRTSNNACIFTINGTSVGGIAASNTEYNVNDPIKIKYTGCSDAKVTLNCP